MMPNVPILEVSHLPLHKTHDAIVKLTCSAAIDAIILSGRSGEHYSADDLRSVDALDSYRRFYARMAFVTLRLWE